MENDFKQRSMTSIFEKTFKFEHYSTCFSFQKGTKTEVSFWMYFVWNECKEFLPNEENHQVELPAMQSKLNNYLIIIIIIFFWVKIVSWENCANMRKSVALVWMMCKMSWSINCKAPNSQKTSIHLCTVCI